MVLKTKNILDCLYKIGANVRVKAAEDERTLDAEIIYLHRKLINIILCVHVVCVRVCMRFIKNLF